MSRNTTLHWQSALPIASRRRCRQQLLGVSSPCVTLWLTMHGICRAQAVDYTDGAVTQVGPPTRVWHDDPRWLAAPGRLMHQGTEPRSVQTSDIECQWRPNTSHAS